MMEPESREVPKSTPVRAEIVRLVREKRYEEALAVLYRARAEAPEDRELQTSIERIKEFLAGAYAKRLGGLDQVAGPIPVSAGRSPDALLVARYIDGSSTFDDIVQMCPLGRLRTLQVLVGLYTGREVASPFSEKTPQSWRRQMDTLPSAVSSDPGPPTMPERGLQRRAPEPPAPTSAPSSAPFTPRVYETEEDRRYREAFARGTAAFVQRRYDEAIEAFEACARMRPGDSASSVMLRRARRDLGG
ncbi:TRP-like protein [Sorangium cellulosum]|uniref:TRP-like protein n=1 Tax=Sorangium cellulosum TaxID=56 RepID=A0A150TH54_SORCE|nr:TRP-like protein [Sorangium cellulosum]KYF97668.1 TRP-like protein [Sorangium cellulosum]KYG04044.1 TRP-like protein [Sorangium cellulosum]